MGGTSYGNQVIFNSLQLNLPTVTTTAISGISTTSATGGGNIIDDGGSLITAKGICWSTTTNPTISDNKTIDGSGTGSYFSIIGNLTLSRTYYVRAYAINNLGTSYGSEFSFTTAASMPLFSVPIVGTKTEVKPITATTATSGGYISNDGGSVVTTRGVCWGSSQNPTIANNVSNDGGTGTGFFSSSVSGLLGCGGTYYLRAYATNSSGKLWRIYNFG